MTHDPNSQTSSLAVSGPHAGLLEWLKAHGYDHDSAVNLLDFDIAYFQWFRHVQRGELRDLLLRALEMPLEHASFQALTSILRVTCGVGRAGPEEATIGAVAEEMCVDPSRASRIVADLVTRGLVERAPAQDDARKAILRLTGTGMEQVSRLRDVKWTMMAELFHDWSPQEIAMFSTLFRRYAGAVTQYITTEREKARSE
jgi:DNA-binding MarR family transcriptional regulator